MPSVRIVLLLAVFATASCTFLETANETGRQGNLIFTIDAGHINADFDNPVAVGALLDIAVKAGGGAEVELTAAGFRTDGVFEVVSFESGQVTVRAIDKGRGILEVTARGSDGDLDDSIELVSEEAAEVRFDHACNFSTAKPAHYGVGATVSLDYDLTGRYGKPMLGYGFAPVEVTPRGVVDFDPERGEVGRFFFEAPDQGATVSIRSTVDDANVDFRFVEPEELDGIKVNGIRAVTLDSSSATRKVWPLIDGERVCRAGSLPRVVEPGGPACSVNVTGEADDEHYTLEIIPRSAGPCDFALGLPGTNVAEPFEFVIDDD